MSSFSVEIIMLCGLIIAVMSSPLLAEDNTYQNPVGPDEIGDPWVLEYEDTYYLYATTNTVEGFNVWTSEDLVNWLYRGVAFNSGREENKFGTGDFWAPEVIHYEDMFYMVYSARDTDGSLKIALASSDNPIGPFKDVQAPLFDRGTSFIDGHIFVDGNTPYLYYVKDCSENIIEGTHTSQIYVQELSSDLLNLKGEPVLAAEPEQDWETDGEWQWNEGPYVLKENGRYYLMYSANYFASPDYAIGYAAAESPLGPWEKYEGNPILEKDLEKGVSGPGHNSAAYSPDGSEKFIVYHTHTNPQDPSGNRVVNIDRMYIEDGILRIEGPTRSPQPLPSGAE